MARFVFRLTIKHVEHLEFGWACKPGTRGQTGRHLSGVMGLLDLSRDPLSTNR